VGRKKDSEKEKQAGENFPSTYHNQSYLYLHLSGSTQPRKIFTVNHYLSNNHFQQKPNQSRRVMSCDGIIEKSREGGDNHVTFPEEITLKRYSVSEQIGAGQSFQFYTTSTNHRVRIIS